VNIAEFWDQVTITDGCWEYQGRLMKDGYGYLNYEGEAVYAHRLAWECAHGRQVPPGLVVMHACDNRVCVNPFHLSVGTKRDNALDMVRKGRQPVPRGEDRVGAKLTRTAVAAIRAEHAAGGTTQAALARRFGVHPKTIFNVVTGKAWVNDQAADALPSTECASAT